MQHILYVTFVSQFGNGDLANNDGSYCYDQWNRIMYSVTNENEKKLITVLQEQTELGVSINE